MKRRVMNENKGVSRNMNFSAKNAFNLLRS